MDSPRVTVYPSTKISFRTITRLVFHENGQPVSKIYDLLHSSNMYLTFLEACASKTFLLIIVIVKFSCANPLFCVFFSVIPQSCRYKGVKYECGLSISCVLGGGRPLDLCSGGMIWACCVDRDAHTPTHHPDHGVLNNASKSLSTQY